MSALTMATKGAQIKGFSTKFNFDNFIMFDDGGFW